MFRMVKYTMVRCHDGLYNDEGNACVMNENGMVGYINEDERDDESFNYVDFVFDDSGGNDDFMKGEMDIWLW